MKHVRAGTLLVVILVAVSLMSAQKITGGLKLGMNIANFHGDDVEDSKWKIGFCGGGFVAFPLGKTIVLQPEVLYSQKGAKWEEDIMGETWKLTYKFNYLEIPVFFKVIMPVKGKIKPNLFLGPYFAIMFGDPRAELDVDGMTMEDDVEGVKDTDFGVTFGGGIDFGIGKTGKHKITFDARYALGLTTLDEEDADVKNNVISLMVGFSF